MRYTIKSRLLNKWNHKSTKSNKWNPSKIGKSSSRPMSSSRSMSMPISSSSHPSIRSIPRSARSKQSFSRILKKAESLKNTKTFQTILNNTRKREKALERRMVRNAISRTLENKNENLGKLLQVTCKNPDNCIALGPYNDYIKHFFKDFKDLTMIDTSKIKKIGTDSVNGTIIEVPFTRLNYNAYTILKCARTQNADNLFYEYFVGKFFINQYIKKVPCFLETYGLYKFKDDASYDIVNQVVSTNSINPPMLALDTYIEYVEDGLDEKQALAQQSGNLTNMVRASCVDNKLYSVLIQHFDHFVMLGYELYKNFDNIRRDLYNILYQIYFGLCYLENTYTHYDFHYNNVGLYKPFEGNKCILMRYHTSSVNNTSASNTPVNVVYEFKTEYVVKIIDYGRSYVSVDGFDTDTLVKEFVCKIPECDPNCGMDVGYDVINGKSYLTNTHWIDPTRPNMSIDLRLLTYLRDLNIFPNLRFIGKYGTPENMTGDANNMTNIFQLKRHLERIMEVYNPVRNHMKYGNWKVAATMDIYEDGRDYDFTIMPDDVVPQTI